MQWNIGELGNVKMLVEETSQYALDSEIGTAQWAALVPPDGGVIRIPGIDVPFTISMFHQLRCLDNIRTALVQNQTFPEPVTAHCMNYIRQMTLCRADLYLENVRESKALHASVVDITGERTCKDWTKVYAAVQENHRMNLHRSMYNSEDRRGRSGRLY